ncbi:MAG: hypothetical protein MZU79_03360 [Anaerotruncus sp.]|nr:hypothetical protein [Anaerotruncus sp.]
MEALGDINMAASEELTAMKDRILFMGGQIEDLDKARLSLSQVIKEAERTAREAICRDVRANQAELQGDLREVICRRPG